MSDFNWDDHPIAEQKNSGSSQGSFDWDEHPIVSKEEPESKSSVAQTALEHFGKGASLGYLPQIQAGAEKAADTIGGAKDKALSLVGLDDLTSIDAQLRKKGFKLPESTYTEVRDADIKRQAQQAKDNPKTALASELAGGLTTGVATAGLLPEAGAAKTFVGKVGQGALQGAKTGAIYGAASNPGDVEGKVDPLQLPQRIDNAGKGLATGAVVGAAVPVVAAGVRPVASAVSNGLKSFAEKEAVNATGATGKQASKFSDDAGRELLDRGIVKFGDSQATIAQKASDAVDAANKQIDESLKKLDAKGVTASADNIVAELSSRAAALEKDPSQLGVAKKLRGIVDDIISTGQSNVPISEAETTKRGFNKIAGNWMDPESGQAGKIAYQAYRKEVEGAAKAADPAISAQFEEGKKTFGLLRPIQEAAERRAATTAQSPHGGLADIAMAGAGIAHGNPALALAAPVARRVIAPRMASTISATSDALADQLRKIPQFAALETKQPAAFQAMVLKFADYEKQGNSAPTILKAADQAPTKGPDKWANDGLKNLIDHTDDQSTKDQLGKMKSSLLADPKARDLLNQASDLRPGSKAMQRILDKIKALDKQAEDQ